MSESNQNTGWSEFVAEIRRRHVVRFALAYGAAAFVVLQLAEIVFPAFGIGEGGLRALVIATSLAFPPALVLAWVYDLTREGIQRTEGEAAGPLLHRLALGALLIATMGATGGLGLYLARQGLDEPLVTPASPTSTQLVQYDPNEPIRSIAVLPLDDFSPGEEQAYFTASMHEELIAKLSMLEEIRVVSRTSVMRYDDTTMDMPAIGRELNVDVIVEGSVTRTPERTRVTLQLIHAPSDSHIETLQWDRERVEDVLAFQTEIAQDVVEEVAAEYDAGAITTASTEVDPAAQDAYFRGRYEYERDTPEGYQAAFSLFEEAVSEDPDFAPALAGLAGARFLIEIEDEEIDDAELELALDEALAAIELDPASAEAREVLTLIERSMPRVTGKAPMIPAPPQEARRIHVMTLQNGVDSIMIDMEAMDTAWVTAVTSLGERIEERVRLWSSEADGPEQRPETTRDVFRAHQYAATGRFADASRILEEVLRDDPQRTTAWDLLLRSRVGLGDLNGALRSASAWSRSGADGAPSPEEVRALAEAVDDDGAGGYWEWTLKRLEAREETDPASRMAFATAHAALDNEEEAFSYLVAAMERGEPGILAIRSDPAWDGVRADPKFRELGRQAQQIMYSRSRPRGGRPPR